MGILTELLRNKSAGRICFNLKLEEINLTLRGRVLDLAAGRSRPSYYRFIKQDGAWVISGDIDFGKKPVVALDLNCPLPFLSGSFDRVLAFNCLYILTDPVRTLKECFRILKPNGLLVTNSPFIFNHQPEPKDYWRWTGQGFQKLLQEGGFSAPEVFSFGGRFTGSVVCLEPYLRKLQLHYFAVPLAYFLDRLDRRVKTQMSLGYIAKAVKV